MHAHARDDNGSDAAGDAESPVDAGIHGWRTIGRELGEYREYGG